MPRPVLVDPTELEDLVYEIFVASGVMQDEAVEIANHLVLANLRGVDSHGVSRVGVYVERLELGLVSPVTRMQTVRETPVSALVDGGNGSGLVIAARAMRVAITKAEETGVGMVSARGSNHCGMLARYTSMAAESGLIGLATTSAPATMAPWGARERFFGTNPLSYAIPTPIGEDDIVFDMATSQVARGKIILAAKDNVKIPLGWAIDPEGKPTEVAQAALEGMVLPLGGAKGSGIALLVEILSSVLATTSYGPHIPQLYDNSTREQNIGHFFLAFRPDLFAERKEFEEKVSGMARELRALSPAEGHERVYLPGELEVETERRRRNEGIPLSSEVLEELARLSKSCGVASELTI